MLDPVGAVVTRHDQAHRIAVEHRQVGAVHLPGDHHFAVERVVDVERLDEIAAPEERGVEAVEGDLSRGVLQLGAREHIFQRHAEPARIAHRAVAELAAGDARIEEAAAVARALVDRDDLDGLELRPQLGHADRERLAHRIAADLDDVLVAIDRGRQAGVVIAHEERVVGRDHAFVEDFERRLELRWPRGQHDQRSLLRKRDEIAMAVDHRQVDATGLRVCCAAQAPQRAGRECACAAREKLPAQAADGFGFVSHGILLRDFRRESCRSRCPCTCASRP